jgi:glutaredoxin 2
MSDRSDDEDEKEEKHEPDPDYEALKREVHDEADRLWEPRVNKEAIEQYKKVVRDELESIKAQEAAQGTDSENREEDD